MRARALVGRYPGAQGAREIARGPTLDDALRRLAETPYGRYARTAGSLPEGQRAIAATLLWHLRVLAGWLPRGGARLLAPLAAGFEMANVVSLLPAPDGRRAQAGRRRPRRTAVGAGGGAGAPRRAPERVGARARPRRGVP
ncbi:hypothetical protein ACWGKX_34665, partial [Streptomyces tricolor]